MAAKAGVGHQLPPRPVFIQTLRTSAAESTGAAGHVRVPQGTTATPPPTYLARYAPVSRVLWAPHDPCHSPAAGATWTRRQPRKVGASAARRRGSAGIAMSKGWWRVVVRLRWRRGGCAAEAIGGSG